MARLSQPMPESAEIVRELRAEGVEAVVRGPSARNICADAAAGVGSG